MTHRSLDATVRSELVADPHLGREVLVERVRAAHPESSVADVEREVGHALRRASGVGVLQALLDDDAVTDIMVNGPGQVWVERNGRPEPTTHRLGPDDIAVLIERMLQPLGLQADRLHPLVDARLPDGSRVNVVVPPLAPDGPIITIRRFRSVGVDLGSFGPPAAVELLRRLVEARATIVVVGSTGAGKTTLVNALGADIADGERVVTVEDTAELRLPGSHVVRLEARPANSEGVGATTMRSLVRNAMRMRPDRLVIGEVRGGEAFDLLLALNTGHEGSLTTCHADDPVGGLRRLETLALLGGVDLPLVAVREQVLAAIDVVVHLRRSSGRRSLVAVGEVDRNELAVHQLWPVLDRPPERDRVVRALGRSR